MSHSAYRVVVVQPHTFLNHSLTFSEAAEGLCHGLQNLGLTCDMAVNALAEDRTNILVGSYMLDETSRASLPADTIIYNLEQIACGHETMENYPAFLAKHRVWDYSQENIRLLASMGIHQVAYVPPAYVPQLNRIAHGEAKVYDVLFYGRLSPRRTHILHELEKHGVRVRALNCVFGFDRDQEIARSRLVLNVHHYASQIMETVRISYLLANGQVVVTESNETTALDDARLLEAVLAVPYDQLVEAILALLKDPDRQKALAAKGWHYMTQNRQEHYLAHALGLAVAQEASHPTVFNLGCGLDQPDDCCNVDLNAHLFPDLVMDLAQPIPWGQSVVSQRHGHFTWQKGRAIRVVARHVLQEVAHWPTFLTNCLDLLQPGGMLELTVPYDLSGGIWQPFNAKNGFNTDNLPCGKAWFWQLGWQEARFDTLEILMYLNPTGEAMQQQGVSNTTLLQTPGMIDSMRLMLRKRSLNIMERGMAAVMRCAPSGL